MSTVTKIVKTLPWGEEVYLDLPIYKQSLNKFYASHGKTGDGRAYIEFRKFGPKPNTENETYSQKLRLYKAMDWIAIKSFVEDKLATAIGWDLSAAEQDFAARRLKDAESAAKN